MSSVGYAVFTLIAAHAIGCGDYSADSTTEESRTSTTLMEGHQVYIHRASSRCAATQPHALAAEVGAWVEFPPAEMSVLEPPCGEETSPSVGVSVDGQGVVFDFSEVADEGAFPAARFDGYEIRFSRRCGDPVVAAASIDFARSSRNVSGVEVQHHYDRILINLQGVRYDHTTHLRVDLDIVGVECANR